MARCGLCQMTAGSGCGGGGGAAATGGGGASTAGFGAAVLVFCLLSLRGLGRRRGGCRRRRGADAAVGGGAAGGGGGGATAALGGGGAGGGAAAAGGGGMVACTAAWQPADSVARWLCRHLSASGLPGLELMQLEMKSERQLAFMRAFLRVGQLCLRRSRYRAAREREHSERRRSANRLGLASSAISWIAPNWPPAIHPDDETRGILHAPHDLSHRPDL